MKCLFHIARGKVNNRRLFLCMQYAIMLYGMNESHHFFRSNPSNRLHQPICAEVQSVLKTSSFSDTRFSLKLGMGIHDHIFLPQ